MLTAITISSQKNQNLTAKVKCSRQKQKAHDKIKKLAVEPKPCRQNQKVHGKTKKLTAKPILEKGVVSVGPGH